MKLTLKIGILLALVVAWMISVFMFSAQTSEESKKLSENVVQKVAKILKIENKIQNKEHSVGIARKLAHFILYFVGGLLTAIFVNFAFTLPTKQSILYTGLFGITYAMSDEFHQYFVPGRGAQITDVCIDTAGFMLGIAVVYILFNAIKAR